MSDAELEDSTRAWWRIDTKRAKSYPYAVAVYQGITRAVFEIDHARCWWTWDPAIHAGEPLRVAFRAGLLRNGEVFDSFIGVRGKRVPRTRSDGRAVFGTGGPIAYWPA